MPPLGKPNRGGQVQLAPALVLAFTSMTATGCTTAAEQAAAPLPTAAPEIRVGSASTPVSEPTAEPNPTRPEPTSTPVAEPTSEPAPTPTPEQIVWMPGAPWEPLRIQDHAPARPTDEMSSPDSIVFAVDADPLGPAAWAYGLPDIDNFRRVGNPGGTYYDVTDRFGRTVRVRDDGRPEAVVAVVDTPPGSMVVIGYGLDDSEVLAVVDLLVSDGNHIEVLGELLPAGLTPVENPADEPARPAGPMAVSVSFINPAQQGSDQPPHIEMLLVEDSWQPLLSARERHTDAVEITAGNGPGIAFSSNDDQFRDSGAVFLADGITHELITWRPAPLDEISEILGQLEPTTLGQLGDVLGYPDRELLLGEWFEAIPLPPSVESDSFVAGPPQSEFDLAWSTHIEAACAWLVEWATTGDRYGLDILAASIEWPTAQVVQSQMSQPRLPGPQVSDLGDDLASLDADQRVNLAREQCPW